MTAAATAADRTAERYDRITRLIGAEVAALNVLLGLSTEFDENFRRNCVTFGYIGNCGSMRTASGYRSYDDRQWMVFLPHPGRVGTADDSIGYFATGDVDGAAACLAALRGFSRGVRFATTR